jgi:hypothetical protein
MPKVRVVSYPNNYMDLKHKFAAKRIQKQFRKFMLRRYEQWISQYTIDDVAYVISQYCVKN